MLQLQQAFRVLTDGYVTEESGTGVVHQAPYFGEDDYRVCVANGVITRDQEIICPVDESGCFTLPVKEFLGSYVKVGENREYFTITVDVSIGEICQHSSGCSY